MQYLLNNYYPLSLSTLSFASSSGLTKKEKGMTWVTGNQSFSVQRRLFYGMTEKIANIVSTYLKKQQPKAQRLLV